MNLVDQIRKDYFEAICDTDRKRAFEVVNKGLEQGASPEDIVFRIVVPSLEEMVRKLYEDGTATLSQHFIGSKVAEEVTDLMIGKFADKPAMRGTIVIGSAAGDFHGLGKKIVSGCLRAHLFVVHDIGLNVPAEKFVDEAIDRGAQVIGVSSMMMHTATGDNGAKKIRQILAERNLESRIKLAVGGAPYKFDSELYKKVGADNWAIDGMAAARILGNLVDEVTNG